MESFFPLDENCWPRGNLFHLKILLHIQPEITKNNNKTKPNHITYSLLPLSFYLFLLVMARILLSIALTQVCPTFRFLCFPANSQPITCQGQLFTKFPWKLYNAHTLPPVRTPNPCLMQKLSPTTCKEEQTRMNQPRTFPMKAIYSLLTSVYDKVILSSDTDRNIMLPEKHHVALEPGQIQISNVVTYIVQLQWWTAWRYPYTQRKNKFDHIKWFWQYYDQFLSKSSSEAIKNLQYSPAIQLCLLQNTCSFSKDLTHVGINKRFPLWLHIS